MSGIDHPDHVSAQYADEGNLETRRAVWRPGPSGVDPLDLVVAAVRDALPAHRGMPDVLEVGSGPGVFAARLVEELPRILAESQRTPARGLGRYQSVEPSNAGSTRRLEEQIASVDVTDLAERDEASLQALLDELHAAGRTIVLITHEHEVAARASRNLVIRDGEITSDQLVRAGVPA